MPTQNQRLIRALQMDGRKAYVIAAAIRISPPRLSGIAYGRYHASRDLQERIADGLGMTVEELFTPEDQAAVS